MDKKQYKYMYYEKAVPPEFCNYVIDYTPWEVAVSGTTQAADGGEVGNFALRKADIVSENIMSPLGCVCQAHLVAGNGWADWHPVLHGFDEVQVIRYTEGGHYLWHNDVIQTDTSSERKVTMVMLLNHPSEFEGGELQIKDVDEPTVLKNKGDIVVFNASTDHRVLPVTKGIRYVAVCWAKGPKE